MTYSMFERKWRFIQDYFVLSAKIKQVQSEYYEKNLCGVIHVIFTQRHSDRSDMKIKEDVKMHKNA